MNWDNRDSSRTFGPVSTALARELVEMIAESHAFKELLVCVLNGSESPQFLGSTFQELAETAQVVLQSRMTKDRETQYTRIMALHKPYMQKYGHVPFSELLSARYGVTEVRLLTDGQLLDLANLMQAKLAEYCVLCEKECDDVSHHDFRREA